MITRQQQIHRKYAVRLVLYDKSLKKSENYDMKKGTVAKLNFPFEKLLWCENCRKTRNFSKECFI